MQVILENLSFMWNSRNLRFRNICIMFDLQYRLLYLDVSSERIFQMGHTGNKITLLYIIWFPITFPSELTIHGVENVSDV
jgi:hypothetical protein